MARSPFPTGDGFGRNVSDGLPGINIGAPAAGAAGALADAAQHVGRQVGKMAERAWTREGQRDAARVIGAAGLTGNQPRIREGQGVDDQAYNAVVREHLLTQRQTAWIEGADQVELENPDSEIRWTEALAAHDAAFTPTGDPELDTRFANFRTVQRAQRLGRVREGQERARQATVSASFVEAASVGRTTLGQAAANAGFDEAGGQLMGVSLAQYAETLARFGPRDAFTVGGIEFAADPSRAGVISPEVLARTFDAARRDAQMAWISQAAERSPDAASKRAFVGQVQERWAAGDPAFAGLDAGDFQQLSARLEGVADRAEADEAAAMRAAAERARDLLTAGEYGDDVDLAELRELAALSGDVGLMAQVDFAATHGFEVTPASLRASLAGGGDAAAGFSGWIGVLLDEMEGPGLVGDDNGRGRAQYGITEASHPEAWRDDRIDRAEAAAIYRREYWDAIGGDSLPPELAFAAASAAVVGGVGTARDLLSRAGGDVDRFLELEEQRFRQLARQDPGKYGDDLPGWLNRIGKVRGQVSRIRAQRRAADGYASDPIGYARGNGRRQALATVAEMNPADLFDGDPRAAGDFLRARRATGQQLAERDGVPFAMFASEEIAAIRERIERDPAAVVTLVRRAGQALGGEGARAVLGELSRGGVAGADLHLARLSLEPHLANVVSSILEGRRLRAEQGVPPAFEKGEGIDDALREIAPALAATPDLTPAIRSLALDRAYADQARGRLRDGRDYVDAALGATHQGGHRFGGLATVNRATVVAPTWLRSDAFDEALEFAAASWAQQGGGPVFDNGQPIPARVLASHWQPQRMANGRYRLINPRTNRPIAGRNGGVFEFDLERLREPFARRHPNLTLGAR